MPKSFSKILPKIDGPTAVASEAVGVPWMLSGREVFRVGADAGLGAGKTAVCATRSRGDGVGMFWDAARVDECDAASASRLR